MAAPSKHARSENRWMKALPTSGGHKTSTGAASVHLHAASSQDEEGGASSRYTSKQQLPEFGKHTGHGAHRGARRGAGGGGGCGCAQQTCAVKKSVNKVRRPQNIAWCGLRALACSKQPGRGRRSKLQIHKQRQQPDVHLHAASSQAEEGGASSRYTSKQQQPEHGKHTGHGAHRGAPHRGGHARGCA